MESRGANVLEAADLPVAEDAHGIGPRRGRGPCCKLETLWTVPLGAGPWRARSDRQHRSDVQRSHPVPAIPVHMPITH